MADLYKSAIGADGVFIAIPELSESQAGKSVVSLDGLPKALEHEFERLDSCGFKPMKIVNSLDMSPEPPKSIFVAMPFGGEYDDTYVVGIAPPANEAACIRVDKEDTTAA